MLWYVSIQQAICAHLYDILAVKTVFKCDVITLGQSSDQLLCVATSSHCLAISFLSYPPAFHEHLIYMAELMLGFMVGFSFLVSAPVHLSA